MAKTPLQRERILRKGVESAFSELSLAEVLRQTVARACELLDADHGAVGLAEERPRGIRIAQVVNLPESEIGSFWPVGSGLAGKVLAARAPVVATRYAEIEPRCAPGLRDHGVVGMPIQRRGKTTGFFGLGSSAPRTFSAREVGLLRQFARACSAAIENARLHEATSQLLHEARLSAEVAEALNRELTVEDVVRVYLDHMRATVRLHTTVVLSTFDADGRRVGTCIVGRWSPETGVLTGQEHRPFVRDRLDEVLDAGTPLYFRDATKDPRVPAALRREQAEDGRPSLGLVPLVSQGRRIGLVVLSSREHVDWEERLSRPIELTARLLAAACDSRLEHARANDARAAQLVGQERSRIAGELHDSVTQLLVAIHWGAQNLARSSRVEEGDRLAEMARAALKDMRAMLSELRPGGEAQPTGATDLEPALRDHVARLGSRFGLEFRIEPEVWGGLTERVRHALFRIAQEALSNAAKHSGASKVEVRLGLRRGTVVLDVRDDGSGLAEGSMPGMGLAGMTERSAGIGARFEVRAARGGGTWVRCRLPWGGR